MSTPMRRTRIDLLRARRERPHRCAAEQRDQIAAFHVLLQAQEKLSQWRRLGFWKGPRASDTFADSDAHVRVASTPLIK